MKIPRTSALESTCKTGAIENIRKYQKENPIKSKYQRKCKD